MSENDLPLFMVSSSEMLYAFGLFFMFCEFGQRVSHSFETIEDKIGYVSWYRFPIKIQQKLPLVWALVQQKVELECFGSMACNRESFKKVFFSKKKFAH